MAHIPNHEEKSLTETAVMTDFAYLSFRDGLSVTDNDVVRIEGGDTGGKPQAIVMSQYHEWDGGTLAGKNFIQHDFFKFVSGDDAKESSTHRNFALQLLGLTNTDGDGNEAAGGRIRRLGIQDIIAIGLLKFDNWVIIPSITVKARGMVQVPNSIEVEGKQVLQYDPSKDISRSNNPKKWQVEESSDTGGLFVGGAHVVTDLLVNSVTAVGPDEEPDVTIEIDDTGFSLIDFQIPAGKQGEPGKQGITGIGQPGPEVSISVGNTTTAEKGEVLVSKKTEVPLEYEFDFVLPKGDPGKDSIEPGPPGAPGISGVDGLDGSIISTIKFTDGIEPPAPDRGPRGPSGIQGIQGVTGDAGDFIEGDVGPRGFSGPTGKTGDVGPGSTVEGPKGDTGPRGPSGPSGGTGPMGPQNPVAGPRGFAGIQGPVGETGETGPIGLSVTGPRGVTGPFAQGPKGDTGDTGPINTTPGPEGPVGPNSVVPGPAGATPEYYYNAVNNTLYILNV